MPFANNVSVWATIIKMWTVLVKRCGHFGKLMIHWNMFMPRIAKMWYNPVRSNIQYKDTEKMCKKLVFQGVYYIRCGLFWCKVCTLSVKDVVYLGKRLSWFVHILSRIRTHLLPIMSTPSLYHIYRYSPHLFLNMSTSCPASVHIFYHFRPRLISRNACFTGFSVFLNNK